MHSFLPPNKVCRESLSLNIPMHIASSNIKALDIGHAVKFDSLQA